MSMESRRNVSNFLNIFLSYCKPDVTWLTYLLPIDPNEDLNKAKKRTKYFSCWTTRDGDMVNSLKSFIGGRTNNRRNGQVRSIDMFGESDQDFFNTLLGASAPANRMPPTELAIQEIRFIAPVGCISHWSPRFAQLKDVTETLFGHRYKLQSISGTEAVTRNKQLLIINQKGLFKLDKDTVNPLKWEERWST